MGKVELSFSGRLDAGEARNVLALVGEACSSGTVARTSLTVTASDTARSSANLLMEMRGLRRSGEAQDCFPLATRLTERNDAALLSVELHSFMRAANSLPGLVGHLVGGIPGRLVARLWGRWNQVVEEPTEQLMQAVGAGHMRFAQFSEEVLRTGLARAGSISGFSTQVGTERNGRGAKVVRVRFAIGPAPTWLHPGEVGLAALASGIIHPILPANERAALYRLVLAMLCKGRPLVEALSEIGEWMAASQFDADRTLSVAAAKCAAAGSLLPVSTALEATLLHGLDPIAGLRFLSASPWPDAASGDPSVKAFALRATACIAFSGQPPAASLAVMRRAVDADEDAGVVSHKDAIILRSVFDCLAEIVNDPTSPQSGAAQGVLNARERLLLVAASDAPAAATILQSLAENVVRDQAAAS